MNGGEEAEPLLAAAVVRVTAEGRRGGGGSGFLISPVLVLTCAHVVSDALGKPRDGVVEPGESVTVELLLAADADGAVPTASASVVHWAPIAADRSGDVALLELRDPLPRARPLPMADAESVWDHGARAVGFTRAHPDGIWHRGRFSGVTGGGWVQLARESGQAAHVEGGFSGSPVWDDDLGAAVGMVVAAEPVREAQQAFVLRTRAVIRALPALEPVLCPAPPFRGLDPFRETDTDLFFGRAAEVEKAVAAVRGQPVVTVYGPSGCGKSSLALAGVVPRMRQEGYDVLVVGAGHAGSPKAALATQLLEAARAAGHGSPRVADAQQVDSLLAELGVADTYHRVTGRPARRLLVVLDQAEALLSRPEPEIAETIGLLLPREPPKGLRVLVTLRADFMGAALSHPRLGRALKSGETLPLTPMTPDQLSEVITEPIRRTPAWEYDPGLAQRILDDAGAAPGVLPLLGFVLETLWEQRAAGRLRTETYDSIGRVAGALRHRADEVWDSCVKPGTEKDTKRLLTGLIRVLPGGGAPLGRPLTRQEAGEEGWRLAQALAEQRLLVLRGGDEPGEGKQSVELAHEALITAWPVLAEAAREDAAFLAARAELRQDMDTERSRNRNGTVGLPSGEARLKGREDELTEDERAFLERVRHRLRTRSRLRGAAFVAIAVVLALVAALGTFLVQQSRVSAQRQAEGRSRALAIRSDDMKDSDPGQAALAALAAYEVAPTQEARSALLRRYLEQRRTAWLLSGAEGELHGTAMSADGSVTLVTTTTGRATLFVRDVEGRVRRWQLDLAENVTLPVVSRDGSRIAYVRDADGVVVWHEVTPGARRPLGPAHRLQGTFESISLGALMGMDDFNVLDFSPDARRLVGVPAVASDRPVQVWDLATGEPRALPASIPRLSQVWFGPDEDTLVATEEPVDGGGSLLTVDLTSDTARVRARAIHSEGTSLSSDGKVAVVCREPDHDDGEEPTAEYQTVRVSDGTVLRSLREDGSWCSDTVVDETGSHAAVYPATSDVDGWHVFATTGKAKPVLFQGPNQADAKGELPLLGTPDHPVMVTADGGTVRAWALTRLDPATAFSPPKLLGDGGTMVVRTDADAGRLRVVRTEGDGEVVSEVRTHAKTPPEATQYLAVNDAESLVADVSDLNHITVRALPSLRQVADFETAPPPSGQDGKPDLRFRFLDENRMLTRSGPLVEYWDAASGRRLAPPVDLRDAHLTDERDPAFTVGPGPWADPEQVAVTVDGEPYVHAVDLRDGKEDRDLRLRLGDDLLTALPMKDTSYMALFTTGSMVELWSVEPGGTAHKTVGPIGPVRANRFTVGGPGGSRFFIADKTSVRFLDAADPAFEQRYDFGTDQAFLAATDDGKAFLLVPPDGGVMTLLRLDPALWKRQLCAVVGRNLSDSERNALPPGLPSHQCPA
ncbi:serine protease [Streptomyces sp. KPB2]|uniref:nSTAND1 domain-containing NTPase n=1 Tax=Streptomyces TaxID=1883 RepID=UPI000F6F94A6|nr:MULTISPECIES: trypsin-like peptidase domain-containing protein [Streptomyces]AZM74795.1 serine protease [Streptomyces sp. KPB2]QKW60309.1 trypsin-like peptidase domain-containing protein [Streptomyces sp. NA03103]